MSDWSATITEAMTVKAVWEAQARAMNSPENLNFTDAVVRDVLKTLESQGVVMGDHAQNALRNALRPIVAGLVYNPSPIAAQQATNGPPPSGNSLAELLAAPMNALGDILGR